MMKRRSFLKALVAVPIGAKVLTAEPTSLAEPVTKTVPGAEEFEARYRYTGHDNMTVVPYQLDRDVEIGEIIVSRETGRFLGVASNSGKRGEWIEVAVSGGPVEIRT